VKCGETVVSMPIHITDKDWKKKEEIGEMINCNP